MNIIVVAFYHCTGLFLVICTDDLFCERNLSFFFRIKLEVVTQAAKKKKKNKKKKERKKRKKGMWCHKT